MLDVVQRSFILADSSKILFQHRGLAECFSWSEQMGVCVDPQRPWQVGRKIGGLDAESIWDKGQV